MRWLLSVNAETITTTEKRIISIRYLLLSNIYPLGLIVFYILNLNSFNSKLCSAVDLNNVPHPQHVLHYLTPLS